MRSNRPFTAPKARVMRQDSKMTISGFKRTNSAKAQSLKQIINVIESTLNQGAQTVLIKTKTMDKLSKVKQQVESIRKRSQRKYSCQKDNQQCKTEFLIGNSIEFPKSNISVRSSKILSKGKDNDEFVPYKKQDFLSKNDKLRKVVSGIQKYSARKIERKTKAETVKK